MQANNDEDNDLDLTADELHKHDNIELLKQKSLDEDFFDQFEDDVSPQGKVPIPKDSLHSALRVKSRDTMMDKNTKTKKGSAQVYQAISSSSSTKACLNSHVTLCAKKNFKHGWVFAVDPGYTDPGLTDPLASKVGHQYRGSVRVQPQDLVDEVFVLRKHNNHEESMEKLWRQARKEDDGLFAPTASEYQNM